MIGMPRLGIRIAVVLVALLSSTLWLAGAHAAQPANAKLKEEVSKQEKIYRSLGSAEGYTVDRSLLIYTQGLPSEFEPALASLGPTDRWLDIGAGEGRAILGYYSPGYEKTRPPDVQKKRRGKAKAVAISIEDRRTQLWRSIAADLEENQIQYLFDKPLREYSLKELGKFQVITDVIGGFSYTDNLSLFMEKVLTFLDVNGSFFTVLQDVHLEDGSNVPFYPGSPFLTEIRDTDGRDMKICTYLKRITCAEVACESRVDWQPPMEAFRVRKTCNDVKVPALTTVHYQAGTPPERRFQLKD
jgi:hypothetical protein